MSSSNFIQYFDDSSIKILEEKCFCKKQPFISLTHFPLMRKSNTSFSPSETQGQFSNNIFTGSVFTSLEFIWADYQLSKGFSYHSYHGP